MVIKKKELKITLVDNGIGFDVFTVKNKPGMGLRNIQTRVESYYGSLDFDSEKNSGTKLTMHFPIAFVILQ